MTAQPAVTRRAVLTAIGAAATATTLSGTAAADHSDAQPEHVSITYDQSYLETYQPVLQMQHADREKFLGLYGWVASSPEHDTNCCVYWAKYSHQEAPWWAPTTGHYGDHEPVQVEIDAGTGEVSRVRASIFHWAKGEVDGLAAPMDGTNPRLKVMNPHHQYTAAAEDAPTEQHTVRDLTAEWDAWLDNGLETDARPGCSRNPWIMRHNPHFWRKGSFGLPSTDTLRMQMARSLGFGTVGELEA